MIMSLCSYACMTYGPMSRTSSNPRITNRTVRQKLVPRRDPYWSLISEGQHLGYRRTGIGGTWIARLYNRESGRRFHSLGVADDTASANGNDILSFAQAVESAQTWFRRRTQEETGEVIGGPYTVAQAMEEYLTDRERAKRKILYRTRTVVNAHILPSLGNIDLSKLKHGRVKTWRDALADSAPRGRTKAGKPQAYWPHDPDDADAVRKRQATTNRVLSVLKAALNHAHEETKRVARKAAWEAVKPFRQVDVAKVRFMTTQEITALIAKCPPDLSKLVRGALLTGCRYGELAKMLISAFDPANETIFIPPSKNGESRHIELNAEGVEFFSRLTKGRSKNSLMFTRENGKQWKQSEQKRPMDDACAAAKIEQVTFHILRHTYASHLAMNQTPMRVIADQLGHKDTRVTERHYAHLGRAYLRETIRTRLPKFGFPATA
jgi:integrase